MKQINYFFIFLLILVIIIILLQSIQREKITETIELDSGPIKGFLEDEIHTYLGVPYAAPPVNDLRWQAPQLVEPWEKVIQTAEFSPICIQPKEIDPYAQSMEMSEDCLYLNVWTPAKSIDEKLPVMVWIHGGAFLVGSGNLDFYNGKNLAKKGVVIVTINYRLGSLGFLTHPQLENANHAFLDQIVALQWVQRNIERFGGDPNKVTIFGESAGAMSTTTLMLSPLSEGLFQRVIAQSGSPLINRYIFPNSPGGMESASKIGKEFESALGCNSLECMRNKTTTELLTATNSTFKLAMGGLQFGPVVDGYFLTDEPETLLKEGKFHDLPLLIGTNANEGTLFVNGESNESYLTWVEQFFPEQTEEILEHNLTFSELFTAILFTNPAKVVAESFNNKESDVYLYLFSHIPETEEGEMFSAFHGAEIPYVFGNLETNSALSEKIMDYWINFAKTGNPNSVELEKWSAYDYLMNFSTTT